MSDEPTPRRYWPHEPTAAARLLDMYAPIASQQPGLQNIIEWQRREEMTELVRAIEAEVLTLSPDTCPCEPCKAARYVRSIP